MGRFFSDAMPKEFEPMVADIIKQRRRTGKTTGACMSIIGECLKYPGMSIKIYDFEPYVALNSRMTNRTNVIPTIQAILTRLGLLNFTINMMDETITYNLPKWMQGGV